MRTLDTPKLAAGELLVSARGQRLRTRNLHDGGPVPPARKAKGQGAPTGYVGSRDRLNAVLGYDGYLTEEDGQLGICLFYKSGKGVKRAKVRIEALGGTVTQEGDCEIAGTVPWSGLEEALKIIRVSKVPPGNPAPNIAGLTRSQDAHDD